MDVKLAFRTKSLLCLSQIILLSFLSANAYSASLPLARPATRADMSHNSNQYSVTTSNPNVATATIIGPNAIPGAHPLSIYRLAQAEQWVSSNKFSTQTDPLGITDSLTIAIGSSQISVNIQSQDSLKEIVSKINNAITAAQLNAMAFIVTPQPGLYLLVIGSTQTGVINAIYISESESMLPLYEMTAASDAVFTLDGINFSTPSNNNVIGEWLLINLIGEGQATLTVSQG